MPTFLSLKTKTAVLFNQTSILLYFATSAARFLPIFQYLAFRHCYLLENQRIYGFVEPAFPLIVFIVNQQCWDVLFTQFNSSRKPCRTSSNNKNIGSHIFKGLSKFMVHSLRQNRSPFERLHNHIFSLTAVIQDFTAIPLAITLHWEH